MSDLFPCVSVVMPVYNAEKYLRAAVESILAQTFRNFELIAIDNPPGWMLQPPSWRVIVNRMSGLWSLPIHRIRALSLHLIAG